MVTEVCQQCGETISDGDGFHRCGYQGVDPSKFPMWKATSTSPDPPTREEFLRMLDDLAQGRQGLLL